MGTYNSIALTEQNVIEDGLFFSVLFFFSIFVLRYPNSKPCPCTSTKTSQLFARLNFIILNLYQSINEYQYSYFNTSYAVYLFFFSA